MQELQAYKFTSLTTRIVLSEQFIVLLLKGVILAVQTSGSALFIFFLA